MAYGGGEIVGVDPATESGIARGVPGGVPVLRVVDFRVHSTDTNAVIFKHATLWIAQYFQRPPEALFIEPPIPPRKLSDDKLAGTNAIMIAMGLYALFVGIAAVKGVAVYNAPIQSWRSVFFGTGNGHLKRNVAKRKAKDACRILGWDCAGNDNAAEAGGIWTFGVNVLAPNKMPALHKLSPLFARSQAA